MCDRISEPGHAAPLSVQSLCLRAGREAVDGRPLVTPLVQSTTFERDRVGSLAPHQYSRVSNPTVEALERTLGGLEDARPAVCFATGLAAETALFLGVLRAGDHVVCGRSCYGGTTRLLRTILDDLGVTTTFVDSCDTRAVERAVCRRTRLIFVETPANPALELTDLRAVGAIAKSAGALLAVDNTFLTPVLQRPLDHDADVSVYSTTKFIEGHSTSLGGSLVTRDPDLEERLRLVRKSTGAIQSPLNAWLTLNGIKTLPLRLERQSASAEAIARALASHPAIARVHHPSLASGAEGDIAARQHLGAHGAVVSFEVEGGLDAGRALVEGCRLCTLVEHVGSVETLITHPATMTHADVPGEQRFEAGVTDGLLRLSVGLEPAGEILADLTRTLDACPAQDLEGVAS